MSDWARPSLGPGSHADKAERQRDEARAERDALKEVILKVDRLFREANLPEHERLAPRDLERLKREVWRAVREALTT